MVVFVPAGELVEPVEELHRAAAVGGFLHAHGVEAFLLRFDKTAGSIGVYKHVDEFHLADVEQAIRVARQVGGTLESDDGRLRIVGAHEADPEPVQRPNLRLVGQRRFGLQDAQAALVHLDGGPEVTELVVHRGQVGEGVASGNSSGPYCSSVSWTSFSASGRAASYWRASYWTRNSCRPPGGRSP